MVLLFSRPSLEQELAVRAPVDIEVLANGDAGMVRVVRKMPRWKRVAEVAPSLRIEPIFRLGKAGIQRGSDVRFVHV